MGRNRIAVLGFMIALAGGLIWYGGVNKPAILEKKTIVQVMEPAFTATAETGKEKFDFYCAACHGINAAGKQGIGPPLVHIIYRPRHHGDQAFYRAALSGVRAHHWPFGNMPPVQGINKKDISDIIIYIRELQQANGID